MIISKMKFYFYILPRLYISVIIEQLTNKVQVFDRKKKKNVTVTLSGLRHFLTTESSLKIMKNVFYFILKALFVLKIF